MNDEMRRRELLRFLDSNEPAWLDENHPELNGDSARWVRGMRIEGEKRVVAARNTAEQAAQAQKEINAGPDDERPPPYEREGGDWNGRAFASHAVVKGGDES